MCHAIHETRCQPVLHSANEMIACLFLLVNSYLQTDRQNTEVAAVCTLGCNTQNNLKDRSTYRFKMNFARKINFILAYVVLCLRYFGIAARSHTDPLAGLNLALSHIFIKDFLKQPTL